MKIHQLSVPEAIASLRSSPDGLSADEASRRLSEYGPNRVERVEQEHWGKRIARQFTHFFALVLWVAAALAFLAEALNPGQSMGILGLAIVGVILVNGLFSLWQEYRAEQTLAALTRLLPQRAKVVRDGLAEPIPVSGLVPGDVILLAQGDNIPADCRVIEAYGLRVDNATVTGESVPQPRGAEPCGTDEILQADNMLLAGTSVVSGEARAMVATTGMHTEFGQIAHLTQAAREPISPLQRQILHLSRLIAWLAGGLGVVFFVVGRLLGLPFWDCFLFGIGILVANVPEGLLPTVTLSLAMATQRMARRNALIRHLPAVETLGCATVILSDKTGTLTLNRMRVRRLWLDDRELAPAELSGDSALLTGCREFLMAAKLCHSLEEATNNHEPLGDPMEVALVGLAHEVAPELPRLPRIDEIPFDTGRMRQSTVHAADDGSVLYCKGALEALLPLCRGVLLRGGVQPLTDAAKASLLAAQEAMAERGLRVLAFAYRRLPEGWDRDTKEAELVLTALAGLEDPPRPEVPDAIRKCREAGIKVIMVTGDHPRTALAIAREIGMVRSDQPAVYTGDQLARFSRTQLQLALDAPEILFARVRADQKLRIVRALKLKKQVVAVTGDGVNDAPALKAADIGIAMGIAGTDVAREAADMILLDDNFASIVHAVEEGRAVYDNIRKFLTYILTSNIPEIVPYLAFALFRIPLPLTVMQILAVDLGTDMVPALGLGAEKPEPEVMRRPPRPRRQRLLDWPLLSRSYLYLGVLEAAAAMAVFFFVLNNAGWEYGQRLGGDNALYLQATTATLSAIIAMQIVNVFLCRSPTRSILDTGLLGNRLILLGVALEVLLILAIDYTRPGNAIFGTAPIGVEAWLFVLPFGIAMLLLEEARKAWIRRQARS